MTITVTEQMVDAAHRALPGISNRVRVRQAVEAAVALLPDTAQPADIPVGVRPRLVIDEAQLHADLEAIIAARQAELDATRVTPDGLEGPGVTDSTGPAHVTIHEPHALAGITEIATRLQVGRSTVAGWVKNAESNGMPTPYAILAAGPVYDLDDVVAWHTVWKGRADGGK